MATYALTLLHQEVGSVSAAPESVLTRDYFDQESMAEVTMCQLQAQPFRRLAARLGPLEP